MNEFGGYVVSDEYFEKTENQKEPLYKLSQMDLEMPLVVAMTGKVAVQVTNKIQDRKNVLFLSVKPEIIKCGQEGEIE